MGPKILLSHQSLKMRLWYIYRVSHMDGHEIRRILSTFMCDHFFLIRRVKNLSYYIGVSKQEKNGYTQYYSITSISIQETLYLHTLGSLQQQTLSGKRNIEALHQQKNHRFYNVIVLCPHQIYQIFFLNSILESLYSTNFKQHMVKIIAILHYIESNFHN